MIWANAVRGARHWRTVDLCKPTCRPSSPVPRRLRPTTASGPVTSRFNPRRVGSSSTRRSADPCPGIRHPRPRSSSGSSPPPTRVWSPRSDPASSASSSAAPRRPPRPPTCSPSAGTSAPTTRCSHRQRRAAERAAGAWLKELLDLPATASVGFVTGAQAANTVGLAIGRQQGAGRCRLGRRARWADRRAAGSRRRQRGAARHHRPGGCGCSASGRAASSPSRRTPTAPSTSTRSGRCSIKAPADRRSSASRPATSTPAPATTCAPPSRSPTSAAAWVHVDGAFGLWAAASAPTPTSSTASSSPTRGGRTPTSGSTCPTTAASRSAPTPRCMPRRCPTPRSVPHRVRRDSDFVLGDLTPESSPAGKRIRGLGRPARARWVGRGRPRRPLMRPRPAHGRPARPPGARRSQRRRAQPGPCRCRATTSDDGSSTAVQRDGTCWVGGTTWRGRRLIRVSVSNATTTEHDIDVSADAILRAARGTSVD